MPDVNLLELLIVSLIGAFWIAVVGLATYGAITFLGRRRRPATTRDTTVVDPAMDDLRGRYARGEIDEVEFEHRRSILQGR
jgi:uncharacterized membrane protein